MLPLFNFHMHLAQFSLAAATETGRSPLNRSIYLMDSVFSVTMALKEANRMKDSKRAGLCLKALHWLRLERAALKR